jgi:signal peptidase I
MTQAPQSSGSPSSPPGGRSFRQHLQRALREIVETVLPALVIVLVLNLFLIQSTRVQMQSMEPTLYEGQFLILEKVSYYLHPPRRGDIVVFSLRSDPTSHLIKRVIGLPGETIEVRDGDVYINGQRLDEPYARWPTYPGLKRRVVPPDSVFVMGDNRGLSNDSRSFGPIPHSDIIARAWLRYWPPDKIGVLR